MSVWAPATTRCPTPAPASTCLQVGALEGVAVRLVDERLGLLADELGDVLPGVGALRQAVVVVGDPDHGDVLGAGPVDEGADVGHDGVARVGAGHHADLHVDDEQRGTGPVGAACSREPPGVGTDDGVRHRTVGAGSDSGRSR